MRKVTNGDEFKTAMNDIAAGSKQDAKIIMQKLALDGFVSVVQLTAKDTGYARNNWDVSVDAPAPDGSLKNPGDASYQEPSFPGDRRKIKHNSKVTLFNNTAYIKFLEDGTPKMPAQPMVKPTEQKLYKQAELLCRALSEKKSDI